MRLIDAHVALLRAELGRAGQQLAIIVGLAVAAFVLVVLIGILLYVGSFLFLGEWLFGSMGWGIIHGTLLTGAIVVAIGVDLGGGDSKRYALGIVVGVVLGALLAAFMLSNVGNEAAQWGSRLVQDGIDESALPFGSPWLVTLVGLAVGALIGALAALLVVWRMGSTAVPTGALVVVGLVAGGLLGAIFASTRYDAPDGVLGLAVTVGLLGWIIAGLALAAGKGFDPEARYSGLVPRESMAAFEGTRDFVMDQWRKQKDRMMRR